MYSVGVYCEKFLPSIVENKLLGLEKATKECKVVYVVLLCDNEKEFDLKHKLSNIKKLCNGFDNVILRYLDITHLKKADGSEDYYAEAPLMISMTGRMDVVYSSDNVYKKYFSRAYPWARHVVVNS